MNSKSKLAVRTPALARATFTARGRREARRTVHDQEPDARGATAP
jgi:hypothetical protein